MNVAIVLSINFFVWPLIAAWRAYCIIILWGWFITPQYGIEAPKIYWLVGALMTLHMMLPIQRRYDKVGFDDFLADYIGNVVAYGIAWPALIVTSGWIWRWLQLGI